MYSTVNDDTSSHRHNLQGLTIIVQLISSWTTADTMHKTIYPSDFYFLRIQLPEAKIFPLRLAAEHSGKSLSFFIEFFKTLSFPAMLVSSFYWMWLCDGPWEVSADSLPRSLHNTRLCILKRIHASLFSLFKSIIFAILWLNHNFEHHDLVVQLTGVDKLRFNS